MIQKNLTVLGTWYSTMSEGAAVQDLVTAAVNEALRRAQQMVSEDMGKLTGGMNIPGMGDMFG